MRSWIAEDGPAGAGPPAAAGAAPTASAASRQASGASERLAWLAPPAAPLASTLILAPSTGRLSVLHGPSRRAWGAGQAADDPAGPRRSAGAAPAGSPIHSRQSVV